MATILCSWLCRMVPRSSVLLLHMGIHDVSENEGVLLEAKVWLHSETHEWKFPVGQVQQQNSACEPPLLGLNLTRLPHKLDTPYSMFVFAACKTCWSQVALKCEDPATQGIILHELQTTLSHCLDPHGRLRPALLPKAVDALVPSRPETPSKRTRTRSPMLRGDSQASALYGRENSPASDRGQSGAGSSENPSKSTRRPRTPSPARSLQHSGASRPQSPTWKKRPWREQTPPADRRPLGHGRYPMEIARWMRHKRQKHIDLPFNEFCRKMGRPEREKWRAASCSRYGQTKLQDLPFGVLKDMGASDQVLKRSKN